MSSRDRDCFTRAVSERSAAEGSGSPEGCWWRPEDINVEALSLVAKG